jgi:hypothetical protein
MTAAEFELLGESEADQVIRWRLDALTAAGYSVEWALVLAAHVEVDLHVATDLVRRGCPPETAPRILL